MLWVCLRCQVLLWLSLKGLGPDGTLSSSELLPRDPAPRSRRSGRSKRTGTGGAAAGSTQRSMRSATTASNGSQDGDGGSGSSMSGGSSGVTGSHSADFGADFGSVWHVVPPSPGGGVLGSGITGDVLAGRQVRAPREPRLSRVHTDHACHHCLACLSLSVWFGLPL